MLSIATVILKWPAKTFAVILVKVGQRYSNTIVVSRIIVKKQCCNPTQSFQMEVSSNIITFLETTLSNHVGHHLINQVLLPGNLLQIE